MSLPLLERDVSGQVSDFLTWKHWREYRNNVSRLCDEDGTKE
jgi:hypothetical protein